jgi:hypothetical protein
MEIITFETWFICKQAIKACVKRCRQRFSTRAFRQLFCGLAVELQGHEQPAYDALSFSRYL